MREIDAALLHEISYGGDAALMGELAPELERQLAPAGIDTTIRVAHFLSQGCFESWYFTRLEEDLDYTAARLVGEWPELRGRGTELAHNPQGLANAAYANRDGNGDEASGDGWRFHGRGLFMLTGRENYVLTGFLESPESAATPAGAVESAVEFWNERDLNAAADEDDCSQVTRLVSGSTATVTSRVLIKARALRLLGD